MRLTFGFLFIVTVFCFYQCGSSDESVEQTTKTEKKEKTNDTTSFSTRLMDTLVQINGGPDAFLIRGGLYYKKGDFEIYNFEQEQVTTEYTSRFTVVLNPFESRTAEEDMQYMADIVSGLIKDFGVEKFSVFYGKFDSTIDVLNNGTRDFILNWEQESPEEYVSEAKLVLFDGINKLSITEMAARQRFSHPTGDNPEKGVKEELVLKQKEPMKVCVRRTEMIEQYHNKVATIQYEKIWISENPDYEYSWQVTVVPTGLNSNLEFKNLPKKFDQLIEEGDVFLTVEHCQNGGLSGFDMFNVEVKRVGNQIRADYREDDVGSYFLVGMLRTDERTVKLLRIRWEMMGAKEDYPVGYTGLDEKTKSVVVIEHSPNADDMYRIHMEDENTPFYFTTNASKYQVKKCGK